jgi:hypothetical protein
MGLFYAEGSKTTVIPDERLRQIVQDALQQRETARGAKYQNVAIVPPDFTRFHSYEGPAAKLPPLVRFTLMQRDCIG